MKVLMEAESTFIMVKGSLRLTIPNPHRKEISIDLLTRIIRQAGITKNDWIKNEV
ncbi:type II toxin-antitoxin system HicA family toxin [uncultured Candidatus Kuenenia sp.]|uniref:type II toxin-antitoxin system HicA family toxin n=1 Tax=uncultured Candidatus Kuenenia sp. TaxID=1048336 RepID=UPI0025E8808B|nr:type II toxin-antitoxin system HicA family toxin [uncultured Candidatus Kuenenia sp.]